MKSSTNNMAFRVWSYFLVFVAAMMVILWMLQITFLEPYYRSSRMNSISSVIAEVEYHLQSEASISEYQSSLRTLFAKENMCGKIFNSGGASIMDLAVDINSQNCYLGGITRTSLVEFINRVDASPLKTIDIPFKNEYVEQSMSFYGKEIVTSKEKFYIFINTPMELLDSTVDILKNQFLTVSMIVFSLGTVIALMLARRLANPIVKMNESARRLARGDYTVQFDGEGYNEAVELAMTLNYATEEFSKTDELRRDLVANVSHDIKTPLTMIKAYAEMIIDISGQDVDKRNQHLQVILDETNHLERLVNDMLTLSKYESKVFNIKESRFNLKEHIHATVNLFQGMDLDVEVQADKKIFVEADEIKMGQVLYNFINNAAKHGGQNSKITIKSEVSKNIVTISVIDYGEGISPKDQSTIWDRYTKINKHHQRKESSSGLGLSIVAAICEATGSDYGVESEVGKGARFYYTLKRVK